MKVAAIILAAGASTRLGEPKQLVKLSGERLLGRAIRVAREAGCAPVIVVLGASAEAIQTMCHLDGVMVVVNSNWSEGMAASIRCGIARIDDGCESAILMACDQPAVTAHHLKKLIEQCHGSPVASFYLNRRGVPACFPARQFTELGQLSGEEGARTLLANAMSIDLPGGELDIDTPLALEAARAVYS